jgi:hypothetical protein
MYSLLWLVEYVHMYSLLQLVVYLNCKVIQLFHCEQILLVEVVNICRQAQAIQPTVKENTYVHIQPTIKENTTKGINNKRRHFQESKQQIIMSTSI